MSTAAEEVALSEPLADSADLPPENVLGESPSETAQPKAARKPKPGPEPEPGPEPKPKSKPKSKTKSKPQSAPAQPRKAASKKDAKPKFAARAGLPQSRTNGSDLVRSLVQPALLLQMVGHPARMGLLLLLREEHSSNVNDLCGRLGNMTQPALSHHLALMRHSGILESTRRGKNVVYTLSPKGAKLADFMRNFRA
jgi:DNA-binding transcriptional ArsR family regulator